MSTTFEFDHSETVESTGGKYASKPGKYHFMITQAIANPAKKDGTPMMGCLQVDMEIVAGTDPTQVGKTFEARLWKGKPDDKDKGEMANKKLSCLAVALGGQHVPGGKGGIDIANIASRQIVAELAMRPDKEGKERLDISYANIFHVDDEKVKDVPKSEDFLGYIPKHFRRDPALLANAVTNAITSTPANVSAPASSAPVATGALADC
jgi:hypothetical protein